MFGTTWKKKSRQGLPEERYVAELFSVRHLAETACECWRTVELKFVTIASMKGSPEGVMVDDVAMGRGRRSSGGPIREAAGAMLESVN